MLTDVFGQTAFGSCRHLLVRLLQSCRTEFLGQKGLAQSGVRPCEEQSAAGLFSGAAQPRPAVPEPVLCMKHRKELYSYRLVS